MKTRITMAKKSLLVRAGIFVCLGSMATGCDSGELSASEALKTNADRKFAETYKPPPKKPIPDSVLAPPSEAEFKAWDRVDPAGEKHLYKWDKKNAAKMQNYWKQLICYRDKIKGEGTKAMTAEPMTPEAEYWDQFKSAFIPFVNRWQQRLQANEPRIMEKSKVMGSIFEVHELIINGYPKAFNNKDKVALQKTEAQYLLATDKVMKYWGRVGASFPDMDLDNPKKQAKWEKFCVDAMKEPKKGPKKVRKKTSI